MFSYFGFTFFSVLWFIIPFFFSIYLSLFLDVCDFFYLWLCIYNNLFFLFNFGRINYFYRCCCLSWWCFCNKSCVGSNLTLLMYLGNHKFSNIPSLIQIDLFAFCEPQFSFLDYWILGNNKIQMMNGMLQHLNFYLVIYLLSIPLLYLHS